MGLHATIKIFKQDTLDLVDIKTEGGVGGGMGSTVYDEMYYFNLEKKGVKDGESLVVEATWKDQKRTWHITFDAGDFEYVYHCFEGKGLSEPQPINVDMYFYNLLNTRMIGKMVRIIDFFLSFRLLKNILAN